MNTEIKQIVADLQHGLARIYGTQLKGVYLFGSYARNEADEESDVDVLIVLDRIDNYSEEIDRTGSLVSGLSLEHGLSISRVFSSESQWLYDQTLFFLNLREEALPA